VNTQFYWKKRKRNENVGYLGADGIVTLKMISKECWFRQWIVLNLVTIFCADNLLKPAEGILSFQNGLASVSAVTFS